MKLYKNEAVFPPGKYVIGDPCYHVPDDEWDPVLTESDFFNMRGSGGAGERGKCHATFKKANGELGTVVAFSTKYGDGVYEDHQGRKYGVDAGLIGIIPLADVDQLDESLAHVVEFKSHFRCYDADGVLVFGDVMINTCDEDSDEDFGDLDNDY